MKKSIFTIGFCLLLLIIFLISCSSSKKEEVVVYTSTDQVFSEPILRRFKKETGIKVKALFDTEETKSTGLVNRLIAEKNLPQCDVFWSNDVLRVEILKQKGILAPYLSPKAKNIPDTFKDPKGYWTGFSGRIRVFLVNKKLILRKKDYPQGLNDMLNPYWKGQFAIANPLFGTTSFHIASLFVLWGDTKAKDFLEKIRKNGLVLAASNGEVARWVAKGKVKFGLVDSDDAFSMIKAGYPVEMIIPDQNGMGTLFIPNAVALIKKAPHPEAAKRLIDYLLSPEAEKRLAQLPCHQIPLNPELNPPGGIPKLLEIRTIKVNYEAVARKMQEIVPYLKDWISRL